jgi:hypothetical protein
LRIPLSKAIIVESSSLNPEENLIQDAWAGLLALKLLERVTVDENEENRNEYTMTSHCPYIKALPPPPPTPARGDWSEFALKALDDMDLLHEVKVAMEWRDIQFEQALLKMTGDGHHLRTIHRQSFLDALDVVSSRTIRFGSKYMLVPFLDMANHASREQGGGYYELHSERKGGGQREDIVLKVGRRVRKGDEIFLDYGSRRNEEWLIYYGFIPERNKVETVELPGELSVGWDDVNSIDGGLKQMCRDMLENAETTLTQDLTSLNQLEQLEQRDRHLELALRYRIARKTLLSALAGEKPSSAFRSAFLSLQGDDQKADNGMAMT